MHHLIAFAKFFLMKSLPLCVALSSKLLFRLQPKAMLALLCSFSAAFECHLEAHESSVDSQGRRHNVNHYLSDMLKTLVRKDDV